MSLPRAFYATVLAAAVAFQLLLGVWGVGHGGETHLDTPIFYMAGAYMHAGGSAYTRNVAPRASGDLGNTAERYDFAYPPQSAPLVLLLALGSIETSYALITILNLLALVALSWVAVRMAEPDDGEAYRWIIPALIIGNFSTAFVVWMGQTALIITAALAGAWYLAHRGRPIVAGALLAVATIKPPLSMFVVLWFVVARDWKVLGAMAATVLIMSAVPMYQSGPIQVYLDWVHALGNYGGQARNAIGSRMLFNLQSLLFALGITTPGLTILGGVGTAALWYWRHTFVEDDLIGVLAGLALLFGYSHGYDVAALVLLIPAFWRHVHHSPGASALALVMLLAISFPNSMLEPLGSPLLLHARVAILSAALVWLLALSADAARGEGPYPRALGSAATS